MSRKECYRERKYCPASGCDCERPLRAGIRYPGDDGTEAPEIRERKAHEYAAAVVERVDAAILAGSPRKSWRNLWGWKL